MTLEAFELKVWQHSEKSLKDALQDGFLSEFEIRVINLGTLYKRTLEKMIKIMKN